MREHRNPDDTMRWVRRISAVAMLLLGWIFILVVNHFHITPAVVFVGLAYFAGVASVYTLYRIGATAVSATNEEDDAMSWTKPLGALDELEREKRALLKAIKEAEFDQQMGKLSKKDAESMIAVYRTRAIEVIKEIDVQNSTSGKAGSVRERILREARARIQIEEKARVEQPRKKVKGKKGDDKQQDRADKLADAVKAAKGDAAPAGSVVIESVGPDGKLVTNEIAVSGDVRLKDILPHVPGFVGGDDAAAAKPTATESQTDAKTDAKPTDESATDDQPSKEAAP